jgi:hypothetical protein
MDLAHKNNVLATITAFSVRKSEILAKLKEAMPQGKNMPEALKSIIDTIDNSLDTENDWDNFKLHFENVHPNFFRAFCKFHPN